MPHDAREEHDDHEEIFVSFALFDGHRATP